MTETSLPVEVLAELQRQLSGKTFVRPEESKEAARSVVERLKDAPPEAAAEFVLACLRLMRDEHTWVTHVLRQAVGNVLRRKLEFGEDQVVEMIQLASVQHREFPFAGILKAAESVPMTPRIDDALRLLRPCITEFLGGSVARDLHARIDNILSGGPAPATSLAVHGAWSQIVFQEIAQSPQRTAWERIFFHTAELKSSEPPKKWRAAAQRLIEAIGRVDFLETVARWLAIGPSPGRSGVQISSGEADYQTGFLWFLADDTDARLPSLLGRFAEGALKKITMLGAVSQKVGNACVNVLAELPGMEPVSQLSALGQRVKYDTAQRLIDKALTRAAERAGLSREQIEEMSVPDCGLGPEGTWIERFGDYVLRIAVEETTSATMRWSGQQGAALKGVPAYVKEHRGAEWKQLQQSAKNIEKMLAAHRTRIERLLLTQRVLSLQTFRACYLDHPLLQDMTRRLIWQFESGPGIWRDGRMIDDAEKPIDMDAQKTARLWHPISSDVQTILHWRCWLEDHGIRQPFKQAHREVYPITDAERQTGTYSSRFAGHVLRQHVFAALCEQRGWNFKLMGQWDSHNTPTLELPGFALQVQYEADFPRDESEVSGHFVYLLIRTGAVRFIGADRKPRPLESIPQVVFSEAMRDIDLFTGVASIGSDPAWGRQKSPPFQEYWRAFSFGELSRMAEDRKTALERLLPKLPIKDRLKIDGRFLIVRGNRTTYRIHLGSGNVLMEPGNRYLCLVQGGATKASPYSLALPFEGDHTLSLILSKAFLLADDLKIKDQSILRQFS